MKISYKYILSISLLIFCLFIDFFGEIYILPQLITFIVSALKPIIVLLMLPKMFAQKNFIYIFLFGLFILTNFRINSSFDWIPVIGYIFGYFIGYLFIIEQPKNLHQ